MPEKYAEIEGRIKQACEKLYQCSTPNISAVAREFEVPAGVTAGAMEWTSVQTEACSQQKAY
jgi:hypothetical protein